jgi:predicted unusual protein kinase regulating ubiquinone biosynthesis (AarF/ABC1/UbiB family)
LLSWVKRSWQLALLARDMAGARLWRRQSAVDRARRRVVDRLGALHGLPQKIGQLLALADLDGQGTYLPLTESRSTLPAREALALLESSLGRKWTDCFRSFEPEGVSASLGQVHRAILHDGRTVAVKIQYPDVAGNIETDLKALSWLATPFGGFRRGFDLSAYQREVGTMLRRELDYRQEARTLRRFAGLAATSAWVEVPEVIEELSTDCVLTMTWVDGDSLEAARHWPEEDRWQAATALLRLFLGSCFTWRLLHADPHPGNYRFQRTEHGVRIGLLDFGCVESLDESTGQVLVGLIEQARQSAGAEGEPDRVLALYTALGFNPDLLQPMAHLLPDLNRILFEPFTSDAPFCLSSWNLSQRVEKVLGSMRWNFRVAGPARLIFVVRAYLGLLRYLDALGVPLVWQEVWREVALTSPLLFLASRERERPEGEGRDCSKVEEGRLGNPTGTSHKEEKAVRSRHLRVRIEEAGQVRVDLTFNAVVVERLADLIPEDLTDKLKDRCLDVSEIAADAVRRQFAPGELFQLTEGSKQVRVWLE